MIPAFRPPLFLRHPDVQTTLSSLRPRKMLARRRGAALLAASRDTILDCGDGVRLLGAASIQPRPEASPGLAVLIHGWEGSIDSGYIISAGARLFSAGYSVFRLNLRDHGHSHHLNREFFASTRLAEVVNAVGEIRRLFPHPHTFLTGFSLGGNFVLRIGMQPPTEDTTQPVLSGIVAICPLLEPLAATRRLQAHHPIYHHYFVRKWKRSLGLKLELFPDLDDRKRLLTLNDLAALHRHFVPRHTGYCSMEKYLTAYRIDPRQLARTTVPTHILAAGDDPITEIEHVEKLASILPSGAKVSIEQTRFGGHCGFLEGVRLTSWADRRLPTIYQSLLHRS